MLLFSVLKLSIICSKLFTFSTNNIRSDALITDAFSSFSAFSSSFIAFDSCSFILIKFFIISDCSDECDWLSDNSASSMEYLSLSGRVLFWDSVLTSSNLRIFTGVFILFRSSLFPMTSLIVVISFNGAPSSMISTFGSVSINPAKRWRGSVTRLFKNALLALFFLNWERIVSDAIVWHDVVEMLHIGEW